MEIAKIIRPLTKEDAHASYEKLKKTPCQDELNLGRAGTPALDYFFLKHRLRAKAKRHISFVEALRSRTIRKQLTDLVRHYKKIDPTTLSRETLMRYQYYAFQLYYGTINQFRPLAAKFLYCKLKPQKAIVDFSAGWGGRCLAAMSLGIPYIGIDANTNLKPAYEQMIKTLDPMADVQMFFQPSETFDFSKHTYDLVMTSPPYFTLEEYEKMPKYGSKQGFLDQFFIPVVLKAWAGLQQGGHLALNMPEDMYEAIRTHLPRLTRTYKLPIANRNPSSAAKQTALENAPRSELVYVWRKGGAVRKTYRQKHGIKHTRKQKITN